MQNQNEADLSSAGFIELPLYEYVAPLDEEIWRYSEQAWTHIGARVMHPTSSCSSVAEGVLLKACC